MKRIFFEMQFGKFFLKKFGPRPARARGGSAQQHNPQQGAREGHRGCWGGGAAGGCSGGARVSGGLLWVRGDPRARRYGVGGARGVRVV